MCQAKRHGLIGDGCVQNELLVRFCFAELLAAWRPLAVWPNDREGWFALINVV